MKSKLRNLALMVASILFAVALAEGALRIVKINTLSNIRVVPGQGITRVPGASYVWKKEGFSEGRFNSHGFRDVERSWAKPPGTFRIAVFGDSYTDALQVQSERTYTSLLEARLNGASRGPRFEVLNLGQSGFGTVDEYVRWLHFGSRYDPDLVLAAFYPGNDIRNNSKKLNIESLACYFVFGADRSPSLDCSGVERYLQARGPVQKAWQALKRHSYLASLVSERLFLLRRQDEDRTRHGSLGSERASQKTLDPFADGNVYLENPPEAWKEAYEITEVAIERFDHDVKSRGARFALVTVSSSEQIDPHAGAAMQGLSAAPLDFDRPERAVASFAGSLGIPVLRLGPLFRESFLKSSVPLHGFGGMNRGHWNERGHALAADAIFGFLVEEGLVPEVALSVGALNPAPARQATNIQN